MSAFTNDLFELDTLEKRFEFAKNIVEQGEEAGFDRIYVLAARAWLSRSVPLAMLGERWWQKYGYSTRRGVELEARRGNRL